MTVGHGVHGPLLAGVFAFFVLSPAEAEAEAPRARLDGRVGTAMFLNSQSLATQHLFRPSMSLRVLFPVESSFWLGAGASGIVTANLDYQAAGAYAIGRYALVHTACFEWGFDAGLGVGSNPPILYPDLRSEAPVVPFLTLSSDASWAMGDRFRLGIAVANEQLSVMHLGVVSSYTL